MDHQALLKQFDHLNHMNPDKFESTDLDMLIKAVRTIPNSAVFIVPVELYNVTCKLNEVEI
jgi:hypothetical protein